MDFYKREAKILSLKRKFKELCLDCFMQVENFEHCLRLNGYSLGRIEKYWSFLRAIHAKLGVCFNQVKKQDLERLVISIDNETKWSDWTKADLKKITKFFFRWLINGNLEGDYPDIVKWIKVKLKRNNQKVPEQILTKEEVELMASKANNLRDEALVLTLYETGCRVGELLNMKIKDIVFDQYGCYILISGKTGWRRVRMLDYSKKLLRWLDTHPNKNGGDAWVWISLGNSRQVISPNAVNAILKNLSKRVGISKPVHPHAFRHARATSLAKLLPEAIMKEYFGWTMDSRMASVYYHLSGRDVDEALLKAYGYKPEEKQIEQVPLRTCPSCGELNTILTHFCKKCNSLLDLSLVWKEKDEVVAKILGVLKQDKWFVQKVRKIIK
ncbi:MAG: tyrosine-type recombinase/integrase, partial [Candidatus Aenigmarchaeota archaeon]|nr:tyrosine-type recombinase/integrase [Candidatus Aenigmarchaeota archaeon]